ncbi:MAG: hypothetical protein R3C01_06115 [Planctomycetaceae bacterium]
MSSDDFDIVDRAVADLLATSGSDQPPAEVTARALSALWGRQSAPQPLRPEQPTFWQQIAWFPLAACVVVMVAGSWFAGFHAALLSQEAGRQVAPDGTVWVHHTDGRVTVKPKS